MVYFPNDTSLLCNTQYKKTQYINIFERLMQIRPETPGVGTCLLWHENSISQHTWFNVDLV